MLKKIGLICVFVMVIICLSACNVFAETDTTQTQKLMQGLEGQTLLPSNFGAILFRTIVSLVVVIGLVYVAMIGLQRFIRKDNLHGHGTMKILSSLPLGVKKNMMIVRVEDRRLVIGVTEHQVSFLCELDKESPVEFQGEELKIENKQGFQSILKQMIHKKGSGIEK